MKYCKKCNQIKTFEYFSKNTRAKDGLQSQCVICKKEYYRKNIEKYLELKKIYYQKHADTIKKNKKQYYRANKEKIYKRQQKYREKNKERLTKHANAYLKKRKKIDLLYKFTKNVRRLVLSAFTRNKTKDYKKQSKTESLLGCKISNLRDHLAKQFQPGMTFENHGEWHIDHIIPLASAKTQEEVEKLCHYTNLQPLWAADNIRKGAKF